MKLSAFITTPDGLYKFYDHGEDWQVIGPNKYERWLSTWRSSDPSVRASLVRAVRAIPLADMADLQIVHH
jgi:hypothetical protein